MCEDLEDVRRMNCVRFLRLEFNYTPKGNFWDTTDLLLRVDCSGDDNNENEDDVYLFIS